MYEPPVKVLENWCLTSGGVLKFVPPEEEHTQLQGEVYQHPEFEAGHYIKTSRVTGYDRERDLVITGSGSRYRLGDPDPRYLKEFPDAQIRFIKHVRSISPDDPGETRAAERI